MGFLRAGSAVLPPKQLAQHLRLLPADRQDILLKPLHLETEALVSPWKYLPYFIKVDQIAFMAAEETVSFQPFFKFPDTLAVIVFVFSSMYQTASLMRLNIYDVIDILEYRLPLITDCYLAGTWLYRPPCFLSVRLCTCTLSRTFLSLPLS